MAERTPVLTLLVSLTGVLEAAPEDMRAGVFTMDLLFLLSCAPSVNLQSNEIVRYVGNVSHMKPCSKERDDSPHVDSAEGKDRRPERCVFLSCSLWKGFTGRQHRVSAFLLSCSPVGGRADPGGTICPLQGKIQTKYTFTPFLN